uniref:Uncharacterized protein n=1 Tax=Octopus bimaculoides TaxID=37653 RepID=A0A0L8FWJ0_OCTBM
MPASFLIDRLMLPSLVLPSLPIINVFTPNPSILYIIFPEDNVTNFPAPF